ncbi:MAG: A/G-specific adenine glycosylase [Culicoidibacterales bacterium]
MNFEKELIRWYTENRRDFPWLYTKNPYHIWICEIMSQQTQIVRVVGYYERFLTIFPRIEDLAAADEQTLLKAWEGLGYYSRVRNMQTAAQYIVGELKGVFPSDYEGLKELRGVGTYTAAAVAAIAFGKPVAAVDGNVLRVYSRLVELEDDILQQKTKDKVKLALEEHLTCLNPSYYNQGLIQVGALICLPVNPKCNICPLQSYCRAKQFNTINKFPYKKKKIKPVKTGYYTFIIYNKDNQIYLTKEIQNQFLYGLYALPQYPNEDNFADVIKQLSELLMIDFDIDAFEFKGIYNHLFSHKNWVMSVFLYGVANQKSDNFVCYNEVPMANAHRKVLDV